MPPVWSIAERERGGCVKCRQQVILSILVQRGESMWWPVNRVSLRAAPSVVNSSWMSQTQSKLTTPQKRGSGERAADASGRLTDKELD